MQDTFYECNIIVLSLCLEAWQELFNLMISNPALLGMKASQMVGINNHECTYLGTVNYIVVKMKTFDILIFNKIKFYKMILIII